MDKQEYREYFMYVKKYVKLKSVLQDIGLDQMQSHLTRFTQSSKHDYLFSLERLELIKQAIENTCNNIHEM